ncbi:MAG: hypothetical protein ACYTGC_05085 [Planctomycetota bacterium]
MLTGTQSTQQQGLVPIWVPDPGDPNGLEGSWRFVDPTSPPPDPRQAAQTQAVAQLWHGLNVA